MSRKGFSLLVQSATGYTVFFPQGRFLSDSQRSQYISLSMPLFGLFSERGSRVIGLIDWDRMYVGERTSLTVERGEGWRASPRGKLSRALASLRFFAVR